MLMTIKNWSLELKDLCLLEIVIMVCVFPLATDDGWTDVERAEAMMMMKPAVLG